MKIYWWNGGLHVEPETTADREALMAIWQAKRKDPEPATGSTGEGQTFSEHPFNGVAIS